MPKQLLEPLEKGTKYLSSCTPFSAASIQRSGRKTVGSGNISAFWCIAQELVDIGVYRALWLAFTPSE